VLKAGGFPHLNMNLEDQLYIFLSEASDHQLLQPDLIRKKVIEEFDVQISIGSSSNTRVMTSIKPEKWQLIDRAYKDLTEIWFKRTASEDLRWVGTIYPTHAYAQDAEMSLIEFSDFIFSTTHADSDNPIEYWEKVGEEQQKYVDWLAGKEKVKIIGEGIELDMSIKGRTFINCCGQVNMPDGEIYTGPVEESVNGIVKFSYPCIWSGVEVDGVELTFEKGQVVKARAEKNEDFLLGTIETDAGASYVGELGIGTNYQIDRFTRNMLFDEKIGGTIHLALGAGYPQTGSKNKSAIHWDLLTDMRNGGKILVDDELLYESGEFKI
jgi:aminopeptidase